MNWHLQDAKNNFSKVVQKAQTEGPQTVTVRGKPTAVVISVDDYECLKGQSEGEEARQDRAFAEFLMAAPAWDDETVELVNQRSKSPSRPLPEL